MKQIVQLLARLSEAVNADILWWLVSRLSERDQRYLLLRLLQGRAETITFRSNGTLWTGGTGDHSIVWSLFVEGGYQAQEMQASLAWLEKHGHFDGGRNVILDIGANIGTTTVPVALHTECHIIAIEPVPDNLALLERNVRQNGLSDRVTIIRAAVVDRPGTIRMVLPACHYGSGELTRPGVAPSFAEYIGVAGTIEVPGDTLENILGAHQIVPEQVALVWCDVQGAEGHVIRSGTGLWGAGVPLYAELDPRMLRPQGELESFPGLLAEFFDRFVQREELVRDGNAIVFRPISEIPAVLDQLEAKKVDTDVFLLPRKHATEKGRQ